MSGKLAGGGRTPEAGGAGPGGVLGDGASVCRGQGLPRVSAGTVCTDFTWALVWTWLTVLWAVESCGGHGAGEYST